MEPLPTPGLAILHPVPTSCRMQAVKPPGSLLGAFSFTSLSHDAPGYSSKLPPKRPWQSSARKKVRGGTFVWPEQRAGRCWQSSATIRHRPLHRLSSADLELPREPRAGSTAARPRAVRATSSYPQQTTWPRGQTGAPPRGPRAEPPPPSLEFAAKSDGGFEVTISWQCQVYSIVDKWPGFSSRSIRGGKPNAPSCTKT